MGKLVVSEWRSTTCKPNGSSASLSTTELQLTVRNLVHGGYDNETLCWGFLLLDNEAAGCGNQFLTDEGSEKFPRWENSVVTITKHYEM